MRYEHAWEEAMGEYRTRYIVTRAYDTDELIGGLVESEMRDALVDIAYGCPSLEAAQKRAREALRKG